MGHAWGGVTVKHGQVRLACLVLLPSVRNRQLPDLSKASCALKTWIACVVSVQVKLMHTTSTC
jgi:hypothetical protein